MPNWCNNALTLQHDDTAMIAQAVQGYTSDGLMQALVPCPDELMNLADTEESSTTTERYGTLNWFTWRKTNWGVKWDVTQDGNCDPRIEDDGRVLRVIFHTAWNPPIQFYRNLEDRGFVVKAYYWEPSEGFCGCYEDGHDEYIEYGQHATLEVMEREIPKHIDEAFDIINSLDIWHQTNSNNGIEPDDAAQDGD